MTSKRPKKWDGTACKMAPLFRWQRKPLTFLITSDQKLRYQQDPAGRKIAIIVLPTNHLRAVLELAPQIVSALSKAAPGAFLEIQS